jgi:uncharacterized membrane protein (UPF0127 family)
VGVRVTVVSSGVVIVERLLRADTFGARVRGLLGTERMSAGAGSILGPARQVHTFGMRYPIDVLFLDDAATVVHVISGMRPYRLSRYVRRARSVLELPAGTVQGVVRRGDQLSFSER